MSTIPYFPLYAPDWLADTKFMTYEEKGLFIDLLCYCWLHEGLPVDLGELQVSLGVDKRKFNRLWRKVGDKFIETSPELIAEVGAKSGVSSGEVEETSERLLRDFSKKSLRLWNPRMLKDMLQLAEKQEKRRKAGKRGGLSKARNLLVAKTVAKSKQKASIPEPNSFINKREGKKTCAVRSDSSLDFKKIKGLNLDAWDEWIDYRKVAKLKKYTTDRMAKDLATLDLNLQSVCVRHSIKNQYSGIFPKDLNAAWRKELQPKKTNHQFSEPSRSQPPDASKLSKVHTRDLTDDEDRKRREWMIKARQEIMPPLPNGDQEESE